MLLPKLNFNPSLLWGAGEMNLVEPVGDEDLMLLLMTPLPPDVRVREIVGGGSLSMI